ncbi:phosphohistidine phosphatase [Taibaiella sp. KBW10]|uniref:SixA phosphatase family protein n=1 Tax=Taibaiella sp. KBW10 TaxID=2153357 RepID=UPI000F5A4C09|nr:histidine phosphatase family protein [Taibaiella sp. KBW10]RQO31801.1 phosphohistidine phosphatase [Taibaiella sp. KBW10]
MHKQVVIIRHAKSSWANPGQTDFDRPLNERGKTDAPVMGKRLQTYGLQPDAIFASTAKRTRQTADAIAKAMQYTDAIHWEDKLYHAPPETIEDMICAADDALQTIYIIAHNPGITEFVNEAIPGFCTPNVPTCGIIAFSVACSHWVDYHQAQKTLITYDYPKNNSLDV